MVSICLIKTNENNLYVSNNDKELFSNMSEEVTVQIGNFKHNACIKIDSNLPDYTIAMPEWWFKGYDIPTELPYEIIVNNNTVLLGPVIAFVFGNKMSNLTLRALERNKNKFAGYENIKGLIYVCTADSINLKSGSVKGYYYNPTASNKKERWKYGVFPLPGAIFKRKSIPLKKQARLEEIIGSTIFNSYAFNKWELYNSVLGYEAERHFPSTKRFTNSKMLDEMLNKFAFLYIKPLGSKMGKGIYTVRKVNQKIIFTNRYLKTFIFEDIESAEVFIKRFTDKNYLIQQGIEVSSDQHVDFRLFLQKNHQKDWVCQGVVGRFAKKKNIVTNEKFLDFYIQGQKAIKKLFTISEKEVIKLESEMVQAAIDTCEIIDQELGHYGDVAIDMIVDQNRKVWILEVNNYFYGYSVHLKAERKGASNRVSQTPFEYAKALCGFPMKN